ncbi:MAG: endonuclease/exonuclease/phosphatase family protein [Rickettsiales bacterium]|nr:endonuclease/exonuclease/phosphatase family protein [Rickettsiales bacterium]
MGTERMRFSRIFTALAVTNAPTCAIIVYGFEQSLIADLLLNWLPHMAITTFIATALVFVWRYHFAAIVLLIGSFLFFLKGYEVYQHPALQPLQVSSAKMQFKIAQYNINYQPRGIEWLENLPEDVIAVVLDETDVGFRTQLRKRMVGFPYWYAPSDYSLNSAIVSRVPLQNTDMHCSKVSRRCLIQVELDMEGQPVRIFGLHTSVPVFPELFRDRNNEFDYAASLLRQQTVPSMLVGDLNNTVWSYYLRKFLSNSGLRTDLSPLQMPGSWPNFLIAPFAQITIDHALVSDGLEVLKRERAPVYVSDHMPVMTTVGIR